MLRLTGRLWLCQAELEWREEPRRAASTLNYT